MKVKSPSPAGAPAAQAAPPPAPAPAQQTAPVAPPPPPPPPVAEQPKPAPIPVHAEVVSEPQKPMPVATIVQKQELTLVKPADLPDYLGDTLYSGEGITPGFENVGASGLSLPMLRIAQPMTPAVVAGKLRAGDIYQSDNPEIAVIPQGQTADFSIGFHFREWIKWADRESGLGILNRSKNPKGDLARKWAESFAKRGGPKETEQVGDKTVKVDYFEYHVFFIAGESDRTLSAIPMSRTQYKKGNLLINLARKRIGCPIWLGKYTMSTVMEKNQKGTWFNWDFKTAGWVAKEDKEFMEKAFNDSKAMYDNVALNFAAEDQVLPEDVPGAASAEEKGF